jgi:hypothetical protein
LDKILKKKYKKAIAEDEILYESLKTNDGRTKYWDALWNDAKKSDLVSLFEDCISLTGNVIECGVWRGKTTKLLCRSLKETEAKKVFYACDSFEGFGDSSLGDEDVKLFRPLTRLKKKLPPHKTFPAKLDKFF